MSNATEKKTETIPGLSKRIEKIEAAVAAITTRLNIMQRGAAVRERMDAFTKHYDQQAAADFDAAQARGESYATPATRFTHPF